MVVKEGGYVDIKFLLFDLINVKKDFGLGIISILLEFYFVIVYVLFLNSVGYLLIVIIYWSVIVFLFSIFYW